jgi:acyl-CoA synthetase (AMP-forming)/AMP-acid ligase II
MIGALQPQSPVADAAYLEEWRSYEHDSGPLVFLVGCQRSGTTWLHLQLARSGAFRFVSAYDVHANARGTLVHNHRLGRVGAAQAAFEASLAGAAGDRGIDAIPARADTPEEYGLVIGDGALRYDQPDTTLGTLPRLRELCAKKALLEGCERPLLLKSPPDYPVALPLLAATWPDASFIAIQRHPLSTLRSQVDAWRQLVLRGNPYLLLLERGYRDLFNDPRKRMQQGLFLHSPAGVAWLADSILAAHLGFMRWLDDNPGARVLTLRYEDMCADQDRALARIGQFLNTDVPVRVRAPTPRGKPVAADVLAAYQARREAFAPFLERFGYTATASAFAPECAPLLIGERLRCMAAQQPGTVLYTHLPFDEKLPPVRLTREETWHRACAIAAVLADRGLRGRPVLLLYPAGQDFALAFLGALLAGAIAAPAPEPQFAAQIDRLGRIVVDCQPGAILSTGELQAKTFAKLADDSPLLSCAWLTTDNLDRTAAFASPSVAPSDLAVLQYTSGSTSEPKGVALTHANLAHNLDMLADAFRPQAGARIVSWLPHFHDMGLMAGILAPMGCGGEAVLMAPRTFLTKPLRWLQAVSDYRAEISGAPNFAFDLCVRAANRGELPALDLSTWRTAFTGAEPIRTATLEAFAERFRSSGFARSSLTPCYGMAEATLLVTTKAAGAPPATYRLARDAAQRGQAEPSDDPAALVLTGCGYPATGTEVRIVDPETGTALPPRRIGEVWIAGPQVARGYWNRHGDHNPFGAHLAGAGGGHWLRSGDLGFLTDGGELVFVDRLRDLIILNGQNYACHDLELTAAASHPALSADACVAVSVETDLKSYVAIVAELPPNLLESAGQVAASIRSSLLSVHALTARTIAFVRPRNLSRTTSGKLQRRQTAQRLSDGTLRPLAQYGDPLPPSPSVISGDDRRP